MALLCDEPLSVDPYGDWFAPVIRFFVSSFAIDYRRLFVPCLPIPTAPPPQGSDCLLMGGGVRNPMTSCPQVGFLSAEPTCFPGKRGRKTCICF